MSKDAFWFPHDANARSDPKLVKLRMKHGFEACYMYWCAIELLREQDDYTCSRDDLETLSFQLRTEDNNWIDNLVDEELIFERLGNYYSKSLIERMKYWDERKLNKSRAGIASGKARRSKGNQTAFKQRSNSVQAKDEQRTNKDTKDTKDKQIKYNARACAKSLVWLDEKIWNEWIDHKKKIKASISERAINMNLNQLEKFGTHNANAIIAQSLDRGWKGLFELQADKNSKSPYDGMTRV